MGSAKINSSLKRTLHLTEIYLIVRIFCLNLISNSARAQFSPFINPGNVLNGYGLPVAHGYDARGSGNVAQGIGIGGNVAGNNYDANAFRDQNGYYQGNAGLRNGYDLGKTYGGGRDYGVTGVLGNVYNDVNGRNKGHQVAGFSTAYQKNENGNKATYYDDGLGHGGVVQYGLRDQRARDGSGNAYGGGVHDSSLKNDAQGNQGQYGGAGGYRNTDTVGGTLGNVNAYGAGVGQGSYVGGGIVGPIVAPQLPLQQSLPIAQQYVPVPIQRGPVNLPVLRTNPQQYFMLAPNRPYG